jgi:radical SAM enzyme (TIGR01210 family)
VSVYPDTAAARDAFILSRRPPRAAHDPWTAHGMTVEQEACADGSLADVVTVFLTGRECPWRCAMCDLWRFTTETDTPVGALARQIREAVGPVPARDGRPRHVKLYNAGSFFDPRAVPPADYEDIASALAGFSRVIVESHPALVGARVDRWLGALESHGLALEVAMGLETAHPEALERLNKRMTLRQFRDAAGALSRRGVAVRAFLLVSPPFVPRAEQREWLRRSVDEAFACGVATVSLIPMRPGNGTVEALAREGLFTPPGLETLEDAFDEALARARGRVFADIWDLERLATCDTCSAARRARLMTMNLTQRRLARVECPSCSPQAVGVRP